MGEKRKFNNSVHNSRTVKKPKKDVQKSIKIADNLHSTKTDWSKLKSEKKILKEKRKQSKSTYDVVKESKLIYEELKSNKIDAKTKLTLANRLFLLIGTDNVKELVMAHDTARIVQCMFKYSTHENKAAIIEVLATISSQMAMSKYSQYCVMRILKYGNNIIREKFINSFYGEIVKLTSHSVANKIIDCIYLTWANTTQKAYMKQEFYSDIYKKCKDQSVGCLLDTYKNTKNMKVAILETVKSNLEHVANKKLMDNSLVHSILLEYLQECSDVQRSDATTLFSSLIPSLLTTKDGSQAAVLLFWYSSTKDRRAITKCIKEHIINICTHQHGHLLILAILNSMDDTKAIKKALFDPIHPQIEVIVNNQWGRKIIQWMVSPADTEFFHPYLISFLDKGLMYSKKEKDIRRKEIFEQIEGPLSTNISENTLFWMQDGHIGLITAYILKKMSPDTFCRAADCIAKLICSSEWNITTCRKSVDSLENGTFSGIEDPGLHMALKKMLKQDKERIKQNVPTFSASIIKYLTIEKVKEWIKRNRTCFTLLDMYENCCESTKSILRDLINQNMSTLKEQDHIGARLLVKSLISL